MTEDEAKTKWCPMVRYASRNGEGINRWATAEDTQLSPDPAKCLGSGCMMWRWAEPQSEAEKRVPGALALVVLGGQKESDQVRRDGGALRRGFCGMAGVTA